MRSFSGQSGQVSGLFSRSGGCGMISSWVTEAAPWRLEVPMQSLAGVAAADHHHMLAGADRVPSGAATASASPALRLFCWVRKSMA